MGGPHLLGLDEFELHAAPGPGDGGAVAGVLQQGDQELPELQRAAPELEVKIAVSHISMCKLVENNN